MGLVFKIFDFDNDGKISADDIKLILSYIPFNTKQPHLVKSLSEDTAQSESCRFSKTFSANSNKTSPTKSDAHAKACITTFKGLEDRIEIQR